VSSSDLKSGSTSIPTASSTGPAGAPTSGPFGTGTLTLAAANPLAARMFIGAAVAGTTPTPGGVFYVRNRLTRYRSPFYGPVAFGTSARSTTLTDWPGGGFIGIHGTDRPDLIPGRVSHGCVRLRNAAILRLARLMPVGTPIRII